MTDIFWIQAHPAEGAPRLREALEGWGYRLVPGTGDGTVVLVADRPDPRLLPPQGSDVLWWIKEATPEEVSLALSARPGWVIRQNAPPEAIREALRLLQNRDMGHEGWLRQMLHLASLDELLRLVLVRAVRISGAQSGAIWLRQEDGFYQRLGEGFPEAPIPLEEAAGLVRRGEAWLLCATEQMGILRLRHPRKEPENVLDWLKEVEYLLLNAWNLERSRALSFKDDLTVAQNRRCLETELPQAVREAATRGETLALLFLDLDNLKSLNSRFGHPAGSRALEQVALEAKGIMRAQDRIYRYGGDEFCILVRGTSIPGARKLGDRLIQVLNERPLKLGDASIPIGISVGIATFPQHADGAERLIERADRALFQAKAAGKGRVVIAA
ncbi:MAG: GGDEF domain-containing protein [Acidobacteria bacterium]|nr:GGDEF domain-containing protein [Acidobacteriota bacterium]